jgi:hypothetical protein
MPKHRWLVTSFLPQMPGFTARAVHVEFGVDKVTLVQAGGWTVGLLAATVPQRHSLTHHNNKQTISSLTHRPDDGGSKVL